MLKGFILNPVIMNFQRHLYHVDSENCSNCILLTSQLSNCSIGLIWNAASYIFAGMFVEINS